MRGDGLVCQLLYEVRLPVVLHAGRDEGIERAVERRVGHRPDAVRDDRRHLTEGFEGGLTLLDRARPTGHEDEERVAMAVLRDERQRWGDLPGREAAELLRRVLDEVAVELQHGGGVVQFVEHRPAVDLADWMQLVLERGGNAEVAPTAANGPEQVLVRLIADAQDPAVSCNDLGREQVVTGQAKAATEVPDPAAEREPPDAGRGDDAPRGGQAVGMGCIVEGPPGRSALGPRRARARINSDGLHARQIDHDCVVGGAEAGDAVRAPTYRKVELALPGEVHRCHDIVGAGTPDDDARSPVDHRVVHPAGLLVGRVLGGDHLPPHLFAQLPHVWRRHRCPPHAL